MATTRSAAGGAIAGILLAEGLVSEAQLRHVERIRSKLESPPPLLAILEELDYVPRDRSREALARCRQEVPLGDLLVAVGALRPEELRQALDLVGEASDTKPRLSQVLLEHHYLSEEALAGVMEQELGFPRREPAPDQIDRELLADLPEDWLRRHEILPLGREDGRVVVAFVDPLDAGGIAAARSVFGDSEIAPAVASRAWLRRVLEAPRSASARGADRETVVEIVTGILDAAVERDASDVHIEPMLDRLRIRLRQDGVMVPFRDYPSEIAAPLASRIKVLCKADIAERRRHQDGRFLHRVDSQEVDIRVSFYVTIHGEKVVLRLLNRRRQLLDIGSIGMAPYMLERFLDGALERPSGVILVTGPTGSGKTSTLYSCIRYIHQPDISIVTAEDPVEYVIDGIAQCSLNPAIDLTYEETLRHIVRQDPDVIVIGEIRDAFSAETAIQAALTGHKVLTTFHTEDSIGGLLRLLNMEIEAFLVSSTVVSVIGQRLLRRVCPNCATPAVASPIELRRLGYTQRDLEGAQFRRGRGCAECRGSGYRGRMAIFELLVMDEKIRDAVLQRRTSHELRSICRESGKHVSLLEDGIVKAARGETTVEEILRTLPRLEKPRPVQQLVQILGE